MHLVYTAGMDELQAVVRDKYDDDASKVTDEDRQRLAAGEPLGYVIAWIPFLGLQISLSSRPLIPRPETEWWTERLIAHLRERFGDSPFRLLDLCAGSGAIGLSILKSFPNARVSFGELKPEHCEQIRKNIALNDLDASRADVRASDLFDAFVGTEDGAAEVWDSIAANPPYIPAAREMELEQSVTQYEPHEALFAGDDGMGIISRILEEASAHLSAGGELWMECDIANIEAAEDRSGEAGASRSVILNDQYGRPRVLVSYFG